MDRFGVSLHNATLFASMLSVMVAFFTCCHAFANQEQSTHKHHRAITPLTESNALTYIQGAGMDAGVIAVTDNVRYSNDSGNIHISKHPVKLSALDSVLITKELEIAMKPMPIVTGPIINIMVQAGLSLRRQEGEMVTVISDEDGLHAQVLASRTPETCLTDTGCEADEILLQ